LGWRKKWQKREIYGGSLQNVYAEGGNNDREKKKGRNKDFRGSASAETEKGGGAQITRQQGENQEKKKTEGRREIRGSKLGKGDRRPWGNGRGGPFHKIRGGGGQCIIRS